MRKTLYKLLIGSLKTIPMVISLLYLVNVIFSYYCIDIPLLSIIGGMSLLPWLFLYLASFVFHFCTYHRMFLYYILVNNIITLTDYYIGIPLNNRDLFIFNLTITGVFLFIILYLKIKVCKHFQS